MKSILSVCLASIIGCQSVPVYNCHQYCSLKAMVCRGESGSASADGGIIYSGGSIGSYSGESSRTTYQCEVAKLTEEKTSISNYLQEAQSIKIESDNKARNSTTALLIFLLVLSGVGNALNLRK